ncbi:MAG: substrate-binding domain-containing protein [Prevotella sp.]|jgi:phosphate transport system substrate-binding protein|nr:substrate-binding domain-containing protein [Prevotella sp.]
MKYLSLILCVIFIFFSSCNRKKATRTDTPTSGVATFAVDECFAPVIQEQVDVFGALYPQALIVPQYTSENEIFNLFMKDSLRLIIAARELTPNEAQIIKNRKQTLRSQKLAIDGLALIVNKENKDTLITVSDLRRIMTGEIRSWKELNPKSPLGNIAVTFDSPNSSTVRFVRDSILHTGQQLGDNVKARAVDSIKTADLKDRTPNRQVIDYVASNPDALGIIGVNWISNPSDSTNLSFINNINVMSVSREETATVANSFKPFAAYLVLKKYPLTRDIYIMISDVRGGLPSGFVSFAAGEKGQRIILKAGLFPATVPTRFVRVNQTLY